MAAPRNSVWIKEYGITVSVGGDGVVDDDDDDDDVDVDVDVDDDVDVDSVLSVFTARDNVDSTVVLLDCGTGVAVDQSCDHWYATAALRPGFDTRLRLLGERMENESISVTTKEAATTTAKTEDDEIMLNLCH
jgi:pantothenate kinase type III